MTLTTEPTTVLAADAPVGSVGAGAGASTRASLGLGAALVAGLPLVVDPAGWFVHVPLRWLVLVLWTGALGAAAWRSGAHVGGRLAGARAWAALLAIAVGSALASSSPQVSLWGSGDRMLGAATWVLHGAAVALGVLAVRRLADLVVLARAASLGLLGVAAVTLAQQAGWVDLGGVGAELRPGGPLGNANFLGAWCVLLIPVAVGLAVDRHERDAWRATAASAVTAGVAMTVLSGTRSSWLVLTAASVVAAAMWHRRNADRPHARMQLAALAIGVAALCTLVGAGSGAAERLGDVWPGTAQGRVDTWAVAVDVIAERPVLGWGPEGFAEGFTGSVDAEWEQAYGRRLTPDRAHNGLLDAAATLGLAGLAALLVVLVATARRIRSVLHHHRSVGSPHLAVAVGVAAGLACYVANQQAVFPLFDVDAIAWFLAGALCGTAPVVIRRAVGRPTHAVTVALVAAWLALVWAGVAAVGADRDARAAADALDAGDPGRALELAGRSVDRSPGQTLPALLAADAATQLGDPDAVDRALVVVRAARRGGFDDGRLTLAESRLLRTAGGDERLTAATALLREQLAHDPVRADAWLELGRAQRDDGDLGAAIDAWWEATRLGPRWVAPRAELAFALDQVGRSDDALAAIRQIEAIRGPGAAPLPVDLAMLRARLEVTSDR